MVTSRGHYISLYAHHSLISLQLANSLVSRREFAYRVWMIRPAPSATVLDEDAYILVSIVKADAPVSSEEGNWHRYVISQGKNQIVGHRPGSLDNVRQAVEELIVQLNARRVPKPGRVHITVGSPKKA